MNLFSGTLYGDLSSDSAANSVYRVARCTEVVPGDGRGYRVNKNIAGEEEETSLATVRANQSSSCLEGQIE